MLNHILMGLQQVFHLQSIAVILFGVAWGTIGGMIPGINATIAMALLLPFTYTMDHTVALMMLAGVYCGGEYGGSIPAILIGTPGTNAAACTVIDGYALNKKGRPGLGLNSSLIRWLSEENETTAEEFTGHLKSVLLLFAEEIFNNLKDTPSAPQPE